MSKCYCIIKSTKRVPFFYTGFWKKGRPKFSLDISTALKLTSEKEANRIAKYIPGEVEIKEYEWQPQ